MELAKDRGVYKGRDLPKGVYPRKSKKYQVKIWEKGTGRHIHVGTFETPEKAAYARLVACRGHHWEGKEHNVEDKWGFLYLITNKLTGRLYVGRKQYRLWDGPTGGYKCTDPTNKEWFSPEAWKENDWQFYVGSCRPLEADIHRLGVENFKFEVLELAQNKLDLHLMEVMEMMERNVLEETMDDGQYLYYNANIASMEFRAPFRKADMVEKRDATEKDIRAYYLKPRTCPKCGSIMPYPGYGSCKEC